MAFACSICGKKRMTGHNVSHANNKTKRVFRPNLQTVRALVNGVAQRLRVCTRCPPFGTHSKSVRPPVAQDLPFSQGFPLLRQSLILLFP